MVIPVGDRFAELSGFRLVKVLNGHANCRARLEREKLGVNVGDVTMRRTLLLRSFVVNDFLFFKFYLHIRNR